MRESESVCVCECVSVCASLRARAFLGSLCLFSVLKDVEAGGEVRGAGSLGTVVSEVPLCGDFWIRRRVQRA